MNRKATIFIFLLTPFLLKAQVVFNTVVPQHPVVAGESFQVQYIIQETGKIVNFKAPVFPHFRLVSGPNQYTGSETTPNGSKPQRNFVYTLEAIQPGRFMIQGAIASVNGKPIRSNDVVVDVISKEKAKNFFEKNNASSNSDYFLQPGEDPYEKIRQNLFLKVLVDRTSCFAGEPLLAIFKLYSRLESNSDIVKNPGFYGFTVYDMVNLADKQMNTEIINGKTFDVHTIRKVQLYPLQAGTYTIDPMEIKNKVEFSRSLVNKKTEQEIVEGISGNANEEVKRENTEVFETSMRTEPVAIVVKPVPFKNKPTAFNGAVGDFTISASTGKDSIAKDEEGIFEITISGFGNFTQLSATSINWPDGIEGFEPVVRDALDKTKLPLAGSRTFRYAFICNKPGVYQLPAMNFSFFDPRNATFKTVSTTATQVEISNEEKKNTIAAPKKGSIADMNAKASRIAAGIVILLLIIVLAYWMMYTSKKIPVVKQQADIIPSVEEILTPARDFINASDKEFYVALQKVLWNYLGSRFDLAGSDMNKQVLAEKIKKAGIAGEITHPLFLLLELCETGIYTKVNLAEGKQELVNHSEGLIRQIESYFLQQV